MGKQSIETENINLIKALEKLIRAYEDLSASTNDLYDIEYDYSYQYAIDVLEKKYSDFIKTEYTLLKKLYKYSKLRKRRLNSYRNKEKELRSENISMREKAEILDPLWEKITDIDKKMMLSTDELTTHYNENIY